MVASLKIAPEYHEQEGDEGYALMHIVIRASLGENHKMFFKHMPVKSVRLLDVGCGDGVFLKKAEKSGFEVWGKDFDSKSIRFYQEKRCLKNTLVSSPWEFADYCEKENLNFYLITFSEVIENQDDSVVFFEAIKRTHKQGGYIAEILLNRELFRTIKKSLNSSIYNFTPHHFLWLNSLYIVISFNILSFDNTTIREVGSSNKFMTKIINNSDRLEYDITVIKGVYIRQKLRKKIIGARYLNVPFFRKLLFKTIINAIRNSSFIVMALIFHVCLQDSNIYFLSSIKEISRYQ